MKKTWFATSLAFVLATTLSVGSAQAAPANDKKGNTGTTAPVIVDRYDVKGTSGASLTTKPNAQLTGTCTADPITNPNVHTTSCYNNSTYAVISSNIAQYDAMPLTDQSHLISVAKGQTMTLSNSYTVSKTTTVTKSVSLDLLKLINLSVTSTETGTVTKSYSTTTLYTGPASTSPYNSRSYYSAVSQDLYNVTVQETAHYTRYVDYYDNGKFLYSSWYNDDVVTQDVYPTYKPIIVTYSIDSLYY